MTVYVLNETEKRDIADAVLNNPVKGIRTRMAEKYGVSTRTIGRVVEEMRKHLSIKESPQPELDLEEMVEETPDHDYMYVASNRMISITDMNTSETETVVKEDTRFNDVMDLIVEYTEDEDMEHLHEAYLIMSVSAAVKFYSQGRITADVENNSLRYHNEFGGTSELSGRLVVRVMDALGSGNQDRLTGLMAFSDNLIDNPSFEAVERLYDFVEHADIEISEDGMLICYKKVRDDFTDVRTGTFDNSPGSVVKEPRNEVNPDNNETCAKGLHVCAKHYLNHYPGQRIVRCEVDPADVVAIPRDYNNSKMRTCRYIVLDEVTDTLEY